GISFTDKYVTQVTATIITGNFCTSSVRVRRLFYHYFNFIIKTWPAAVRLKLVGRLVQWSPAPYTYVSSFFLMVIIFPANWTFSHFLQYYIFLKFCQWFIFIHLIFLLRL